MCLEHFIDRVAHKTFARRYVNAYSTVKSWIAYKLALKYIQPFENENGECFCNCKSFVAHKLPWFCAESAK